MILVSYFVLGWLAGIATLAIASIIVINYDRKKLDKEEFVKALVEKEGWMGAQEILNWSYNGKYFKIWRKMYMENLLKKGEDK